MLFFILEPNVLVIRQILLCSCQCAKKLNKNTKLTEEEIETIQKQIRFFVFFTLGYLYPQATITLSCNCLDLSCILRYSLKGGDPAAPSDTATLLRLHPSHRSYLRRLPPCGWLTDFGYSQLPWRDGRCVQDPGTHSPRHSDSGLLATPTSCGRVAAHNPN